MDVLETHELTRRFGELLAVDAMSIRVQAQHVFGLLGSNGAGKTTAIKMLTTLLPPTGCVLSRRPTRARACTRPRCDR